MIITEKVIMKWHGRNKKHFENLGYKFTKLHDEFEVNVKDLMEGSKTRIKYSCDFCNEEYEKGYVDIIYARAFIGKNIDRCFRCRKGKYKTLAEEFPHLIKEWHPDNKYSILDYNSKSHIVVLWKCENNHEFTMGISGRAHGNSCPHCPRSNSKGEQKIKDYLIQNNIKYIQQYSFNNLLSENNKPLKFDFAILKDNDLQLLIEFDGGQHFEVVKFYGEEHFKNTVYRDNLKNKYCEENNIKLLRIPYWEIKNIEEIINKALDNL